MPREICTARGGTVAGYELSAPPVMMAARGRSTVLLITSSMVLVRPGERLLNVCFRPNPDTEVAPEKFAAMQLVAVLYNKRRFDRGNAKVTIRPSFYAASRARKSPTVAKVLELPNWPLRADKAGNKLMPAFPNSSRSVRPKSANFTGS